MSTENWKLESALCRCCHAEGSFENLGVSTLYRGVEEVYSDMLRDSLDITLTPVSGPLCELTYTICKSCIQKLRDATNFKKQVLACEQCFIDLYSRNVIKVLEPELDAVVKEEVPDTEVPVREDTVNMEVDIKTEQQADVKLTGIDFGVHFVANGNNDIAIDKDSAVNNTISVHQTEVKQESSDFEDDMDCETDFVQDSCVLEPELDAVVREEVPDTEGDDEKDLDVDIKLENDMKKNKRKGKSESKSTGKEKKVCRKVGRPRKIKEGEDAEDKQSKVLEPELDAVAKEEVPDTEGCRRTTRINKIEPRPVTVEVKLVAKKQMRPPRIDLKGPLSPSKKNIHNLRNILLYSNANPIRYKNSLGYGCLFCPKQFQEPTNLKKHFLVEHHNDGLIKYMSGMSGKLFNHVVKLDITYLNCALCDKDIPRLEEMTVHLLNDHDKPMFVDMKSQILPFKFDTAELRCAVCTIEYATFKLLQEHMNVHFRNYICDICSTGFVTERLLTHHVKRHRTGEFKCEQCDKTFTNEQNRWEHKRRTHLGFSKRHKCKFCEERFIDYWNKMDHMVKEHGVPPVVLKCQACERTFDNQRALAKHTKKDHLLERKHKCSDCDMKFFSTSGLKKHMAKHTGLRQFRCDVCLKAYGRKNTLREHMRIHADDRRFSCVHCGQAFVQKCSWRIHMRSKHGEEV